MSDAALRAKLIRLAHTNPELRESILPLVSDRKAGWTQGVFDQKEIDSAMAPVATAVLKARSRLQQMLDENEKMSRVYGMAGMEYREELAAARESRKMLMNAMRHLDVI